MWATLGCLVIAAVAWRWSQPRATSPREESPAQIWERAEAALDVKDWKAVQTELSVLETYPDYDSQVALLRGALLAQQQRPEAIAMFKRASTDPRLRMRALLGAAELFYNVGKLPDSLMVLKEAVQVDPDNVDAHRWLAAAYYDLGLNVATETHLQYVAKLAPEDARPFRQLGLMHKDFQIYEQAVNDYREALKRQPQAVFRDEVLLEMADCQVKLFRYEDALKTCAEAKPGPTRWTLEAECHLAEGRIKEAEELLLKTLAEIPAHPTAGLLRGKMLLDEGKAEEAAKLLRRVAEGNPPDFEVRFQLSQALRQAGKTEEADIESKRAEVLRETRLRFNKLHTEAGDRPNDPEVRFRLAETALEMGRPDLAGMWYQSALALNPQHAGSLAGLKKLQSATSPSENSKP